MSARIEQGDCLEVMARMIADGVTVDSVVTDPPYHLTSIVKRFGAAALNDETRTSDRARRGADGMACFSRGFMGQQWDGGDIAFQPETWRLAFDLLKPGGHLLAMGGTRTYHRLACAIEDAGFEIRDQIGWLYGSGFPKSHNLDGEWEGWGTALKPAWEPIVVARKPLAEKTVAANVLQHGTAALNIDGCRVGDFVNKTPPGTDRYNQANFEHGYRPGAYQNGREGEASADRRYTDKGATNFAATPGPRGGDVKGRWPANVIHDGSEEVLAAFAQFGERPGCKTPSGARPEGKILGGARSQGAIYGDSGTAARFFYCAKASKADRAGSKHPTVKPVALMAYLCRLITPPGGTVLDPFAGSGTTGAACMREGFSCILIEREAAYIEDIRRRMDPYADGWEHAAANSEGCYLAACEAIRGKP